MHGERHQFSFCARKKQMSHQESNKKRALSRLFWSSMQSFQTGHWWTIPCATQTELVHSENGPRRRRISKRFEGMRELTTDACTRFFLILHESREIGSNFSLPQNTFCCSSFCRNYKLFLSFCYSRISRSSHCVVLTAAFCHKFSRCRKNAKRTVSGFYGCSKNVIGFVRL